MEVGFSSFYKICYNGFRVKILCNNCYKKKTELIGDCREIVGSVAERVKASFLRRPDRMISVQLEQWSCCCVFGEDLYDDYLSLVASNKQQTLWAII